MDKELFKVVKSRDIVAGSIYRIYYIKNMHLE